MPWVREARRAVSIAKLAEFERQVFWIGEQINHHANKRAFAADVLFDIAQANDLVAIHGDDLIIEILAAGLDWSIAEVVMLLADRRAA